jgi:hypothetical protein
MDHEQTHLLRYCLFLGTMVTAVSLVPEALDPLIKPALRCWSWLKHSVQKTRERFQRGCRSSFWEIDMTKFEP